MTSLLPNPFRRILRFVKSRPVHSSDTLPLEAGPSSFYQLSHPLATGQPFAFAGLRGKQVLLVNTPPNAATTSQYQELQQLAARFADDLVVVAFPSHDFAEPGAPAHRAVAGEGSIIVEMQPSVVIKSAHQNAVLRWLSSARHNGWNEQAPPRPFSKYLVSAAGQLTHYFGPMLSPLSETVVERISKQ